MFIKVTDPLMTNFAIITLAEAESLLKDNYLEGIPTAPQGISWIDAGKITSMRWIEPDNQYIKGHTTIRFDNNDIKLVQETPEEILDKIAVAEYVNS